MGETIAPLLTVKRAAVIAGLHPETLHKAIRQGKLEAYRRPRATRIAPEALKAYMDLYLCPATDQTDRFSNYTGARSASSGGKKARDGAPRQAMRMNAALDRH